MIIDLVINDPPQEVKMVGQIQNELNERIYVAIRAWYFSNREKYTKEQLKRFGMDKVKDIEVDVACCISKVKWLILLDIPVWIMINIRMKEEEQKGIIKILTNVLV